MDWQPQNEGTSEDSQKGTTVAEATEYPAIVVLGKLPDGKLVKNFAGEAVTLSDRTLKAIQILGIKVEDNEENYLF